SSRPPALFSLSSCHCHRPARKSRRESTSTGDPSPAPKRSYHVGRKNRQVVRRDEVDHPNESPVSPI
ncbi:hypothetical protein PFISCL1PPCAC_9640, partial [Pristionchus fissidentatus]